ncbi:MAG: MSMEG_0568 family radical SAM protein [Candidatus Methylarchaceae archaeon HK01B]|nr:MSMEG_0568 family radical SAM protein [Candidatus Methylarchaceae archaeon HK01M]MCP8311366.1 MSMEG_0568 family radical SAM protein [Candidatus Methylarchaceae archaeon HK02M1]MCP8319288.1 MSMEG_0568 family radical SAM protein [Candidatus Methylarchaceae archaeon HK01B]
MIDEPTKLKAELLCLGAKLENPAGVRRGGAGPAGGKFFNLPNRSNVNVPVYGSYIDSSPFKLVKQKRNNYILFKNGIEVCELDEVPRPSFYEKLTSDGTPMWKIALLHGSDCLASTVVQSCHYWMLNKPCKFCAIELSLSHGSTTDYKRPEQIAEVACSAVKDGVRHVTLTIGTTAASDKGALTLAKTVQSIKEVVELPVHVQVEPPSYLNYIDTLYSSGADTIGIHVETLDREVLESVCPMKPQFEEFMKAWKRAVKLFGENQVSSYVIVGLGEDLGEMLEGLRLMSQIGVIPYIVPLRPMPGTQLQKSSPPDTNTLLKITDYACKMMNETGLNPYKNVAGCVRCGSCSMIKEIYK